MRTLLLTRRSSRSLILLTRRSSRSLILLTRRSPRSLRVRLALCVAAIACVLPGVLLPQVANAKGGFALSKDSRPHTVCPELSPGNPECEAVIVPVAPAHSAESYGPEFVGSGIQGGLDPQDLRSAYKLSNVGGSSQTVALVEAYNDPYAEADLKVYRERYGLPACTKANKCFKTVNQNGETKNYPEGEPGWGTETSLDLDMVSAACGECHILLVESNGGATEAEYLKNMLAAEETAVTLKATEISNTWDNFEFAKQVSYDKAFDHPGIPITAASGDFGYTGRLRWPGSSQYVISVGGTRLTKADNARGWTEEVWREPVIPDGIHGAGTTSGCSAYEPKPAWQTDKACPRRAVADVAVDASSLSPVSFYDTYYEDVENEEGEEEIAGGYGWEDIGGTSVGAPFVAGVEALSSSYARSLGAEAFYLAGKKGSLFDVTEGSNGTCVPPAEDEYFCTAEVGYDGPTGWGAPDGPLDLAARPIAITEPATAVTPTAATLTGTVDPEGSQTTYYFEYGTTPAYGSKTVGASAGSGTSNISVSAATSGLSPDTLYHYRLVANSPGGVSYGADLTFTTGADSPPQAPTLAGQFGAFGTGAGEFDNPQGIAVAPDGDVWVADAGNNRVQELSPTGAFIEAVGWGVSDGGQRFETCTGNCRPGIAGSDNGQFSNPRGIAVDAAGDVWVADSGNNRVQELSPSGQYLQQFGEEGIEPGQLEEPTGIAVDASGNVWVSSSRYYRVEEFTSSGRYERKLGTFEIPLGIAVDSHGDVWVADERADSVQELSSSGQLLGSFGSSAVFNAPTSVAIDADGNVWVADRFSGRVHELAPSGQPIEATGDAFGDQGQFGEVWGLATSGSLIYVVDTGNGRIEVWRR
jgi:streptogramin lyase